MDRFIGYPIKNFVDKPEGIQVRLVENAKDFFLFVQVFKKGRIIKSLKMTTFMIGARLGTGVRLELVESL